MHVTDIIPTKQKCRFFESGHWRFTKPPCCRPALQMAVYFIIIIIIFQKPGHGCLAVRAYSTGHNNNNKKTFTQVGCMHLPLFIFFFCFPTGNTTNPPPTTYYPPLTTQGPSGNENKHENNFQRKRIQIEILTMLAQSVMFLLKIATSPYPTD